MGFRFQKYKIEGIKLEELQINSDIKIKILNTITTVNLYFQAG